MKILAMPIALGALGAIAVSDAREDLAQESNRRSDSRDCFNPRSVNGYTPEGDHAVIVRVGSNREYRLELAGYCPDVD